MKGFLNTLRKNLNAIPQLRFHILEPGCNGYDFHHHREERTEFVVGRVADLFGAHMVQIQLQDKRVSRNHCRIYYHPQGFWMIEDLGSTNGTFIHLPAATNDTWQTIRFATPVPAIIDIRVGTTLMAMRPLEGAKHIPSTPKSWNPFARQAA
ncbi:MAG: FHA domain-containing protein [Magnetococcales bacterium]|nr:FHA domain-containing protein [Magnetococcales bacterium]